MDKETVVYNGMLFNCKQKEILQCVTTWMNLEDILLREISQSQKDNTKGSHPYEVSKVVKFIASKGMVAARHYEKEKREVTNQWA